MRASSYVGTLLIWGWKYCLSTSSLEAYFCVENSAYVIAETVFHIWTTVSIEEAYSFIRELVKQLGKHPHANFIKKFHENIYSIVVFKGWHSFLVSASGDRPKCFQRTRWENRYQLFLHVLWVHLQSIYKRSTRTVLADIAANIDSHNW
jgi:hypothetical protein